MKIKNYLPRWIYEPLINFYNRYINRYYQSSYAQEGEDLIINRMIYGKIDQGFFVDVGAHHPKRFSNTYFFYKKGWKGISIEARPGSKKMFDKYRPKDINLEIPIYSKEVELTYYQFNDSALNGFSRELSEQRDKLNHYRIIRTTKLKTKTLKDILDHHLPIGKQIDLLSIDVEGLDMEVLKSNDWSKYLPTIILVEDKEFDFESPEESEIYSYLSQKKYKLVGKTLNTLILILKDNWIGI